MDNKQKAHDLAMLVMSKSSFVGEENYVAKYLEQYNKILCSLDEHDKEVRESMPKRKSLLD